MEQRGENNASENLSANDLQIILTNSNEPANDAILQPISSDSSNSEEGAPAWNPILSNSEGPSIFLDYFENDVPFINNRSYRRNAFRFNQHERSYSRYFNSVSLRYDIPTFETHSFNTASNLFDLNSENVDEPDNCTNFFRSSKTLYGSLTISTVKKLLSLKLMHFMLHSDRIFKKVLEVYTNNITIEKEDPKSMFKLTKLFIGCLPTLKYIQKFTKKVNFSCEKQKKNIFFLKLCLDIYENYYKTLDFPLFRKYKSNFLPTAIKFYSKLPEGTITFINELISLHHLESFKIGTIELKSKGDFLDFYAKDQVEYSCLTGGLDWDKLVN